MLNTKIDISEPAVAGEVIVSEAAASSTDPTVQRPINPPVCSIALAVMLAEPIRIRVAKLTEIVSTAAIGVLSPRLPAMAPVELPSIETLRKTIIRCHRQTCDHLPHLQVQVELGIASDGPVSSRINFPSDDLEVEPVSKKRRHRRSAARSPTPIFRASQSEDEDAAVTAVLETSPFRENPQLEFVEEMLVEAAITSMESEAQRLSRLSPAQRSQYLKQRELPTLKDNQRDRRRR